MMCMLSPLIEEEFILRLNLKNDMRRARSASAYIDQPHPNSALGINRSAQEVGNMQGIRRS